MSGTVDPRIALSVQAPQVNPLLMAGQTAQVGNALTQFQRGQEEFQARQAIGEAMAKSIDPNTGKYDPYQFYRQMATNPMSRFMTPEALIQGKQLESGQLAIQQQQAQLGMIRLGNLSQALTGLLANQNVTPDLVMETIGRLVALPENERPFTAATAASLLATMPRDPQQLRQWLMEKAASTTAGVQNLQTFLPQPLAVPYGGGTGVFSRDPVTGQVGQSPTLNVPNTPTPSEMNQLVDAYNPRTRQMEKTPRYMTVPMTDGSGRLMIAPPGQQGQPGLGTGRYPGQGPAAVPGAPIALPNSVPSTPPLGEEQAAARIGEQSGRQVADLQQAAAQYPQVRSIVDNLDSLLDKFETGPGADWQKAFQAWYNRNIPTISGGRFNFDPSRLASQEEFNKLTYQLAQAQFQQLGGTGTDNQLGSAMATSPNELITREGNRGILAMLRGNNEALRVQQQEWEKFRRQPGRGDNSYGEFVAEWNKIFDPRVFQIAAMKNPADRARITNSMTQAEYDAFKQRYLDAQRRGWVGRPTVQTPPPARRDPPRVPPGAGAVATQPLLQQPPPRPGYEDPRTLGYTGP